MKKKFLGIVLSVLMILSSLGTFVYAEGAELAATDWTQMILSVKANSLANETKNYSSMETMWDPATEYHYNHYVSFQGSNEEGNKDYGGGSPVFYIGNWSIGTIPSKELDGKFYVGMLVRTNSASKPIYNPLNITSGSGLKAAEAANAFAGNGEWEFNSIDFELPTTVDGFKHGHLKFGTESGKYIDVAAWGLFATSVSKTDAEAALKNASKVSEADIVTTSIADADGNITKAHLVGAVTLPDYEDTEDTTFAGWTTTKGSYTVVAAGGASYTPTESVILYPVWKKNVRFVNGTAETNGDGMTADTPYNTFASAAADLATTGGTIVVVGGYPTTTKDGTVSATIVYSALNNTGDITITSVYDGVDYREKGAALSIGQPNFGYVTNPGKVVFTDINLVTLAWQGVYIQGHPVEFTETCNFQTIDGTKITSIQLMGLISGTSPTANHTLPMDITVGNTNCTSLILGARSDVKISDVNIRITKTGTLPTISLANNIGAGADIVYPAHGQLTIDGDVKITVEGTLKDIGVRLYNKDAANNANYDENGNQYSGLASFTGDLSVIIAPGGRHSGTISDDAKPTDGNWYKVTVAEGASVAYGEKGRDFVLTLNDGQDYNFVNLTNSTTSNTYSYYIDNGIAKFTLVESGEYTMTYSKNESKTVSFVDKDGGNDVDDITTISGLAITLPTLSNTDFLTFMGWTATENGTEVQYNGGDSFIVSEDVTLYSVWTEAETYTVTFMNGDEEFASFTSVEGKTIQYPDAYPEKDGYYFTGWDNNPATIGTEDIILNATFKTAAEVGYHYYYNGEAASDGDGSYNKPFSDFKSVIKALNATGGTVILTGKGSTVYQPRLVTVEDVVFTAVDPLTGRDFRGEFVDGVYVGGHFYLSSGTYWGGAEYQTGKIKVENIDIVYVEGAQHWTFDGHPYELGENVVPYNGTTTAKSVFFFGGTSSNNAADPHIVRGTFRSPYTDTANWVVRGNGAYELDGVEYEFYAKTKLNFAHDSSDVTTFNGPLNFTFFDGSTGSTLYHGKTSYAFGSKAYASVILNDGVTITNSLNVTEAGLDGKLYTIKSTKDGVVTHTGTKGTYRIESDTYNYAQILNSENTVIDEGIIVGGAELSVSDYGEYTVAYSNKTLYGIDYVTSPYDSICPASYVVTSEETDKHTITLPTLAKQNAHTFMGWTTSEGGETAEYSGGTQYTLTGKVTLYAVWEDIPTFTVTFKNDDGDTIHTSTGYAGAPLDFPTEDPYKYGEKLLGYAYDGTTDILGADSVIPDSDKVALPVWGEIPAGETRLYVNADSGNDEKTGISPDAALATIGAAVAKLNTSGGYIIVTGGKNAISTNWNNAGDITLTSLDPVSGIDYRAKTLSEDKLSFTGGAVITYAYTPFGQTTITGKVTINNVTLLNATNHQFICFEGHPYELGKGILVYQQTADDAEITSTALNVRSLGEGADKTNADGIIMTINGLEVGTSTIYTVGKATNTVPGIDITVDSDYAGNLIMGNDSNGGITTIKGAVRFTFNGSLTKALGFSAATQTNPVEGNVYAIYNNGATANISAMRLAEGYGIYSLSAGENVVLSHGDQDGTFVIEAQDGIGGKYVQITDADGTIVEYANAENGRAVVTLENTGAYTAQYTDIAMRMLTFETGDETITVTGSWYVEGSEVEISTDLYRYGYKFLGWSDGTRTYTEGLITMPANNVTLTAVWEESPKYTITFDANGSDIAVPGDVIEYEGENVELPKIISASSTFAGWSENKDATSGYLNHVVTKDTTLYAITTDGPVYVVDSYYRGDPNNYTGTRNSFRRYVIDVYLENAVASEGKFKLNTDNKFLYYLGHVPQDGITATVTANVVSGSSGTPGLQYFTTPSVEFNWTSDSPVDATNGRMRVARIMMYFSSWGMGYDQIEARTTDEVVSPFAGYTATAGDKTAFVTANFYKGVKSDEVKINGKVTLEGRESGTGAMYDNLKLYIMDDAGDAVEFKVLENAENKSRTFTYIAEIAPGDYTMKVVKDGYLERTVPVTITESATIPEIVLFAGDTLDENGNGDGVIDIDDFTRILRGFAPKFPLEKYINAIDINEDGTVNVSDLSVIKNSMTTTVRDPEIVSSVDKNGYKLSDWKVTANSNKISIIGGSDAAVENALSHIENMYNKNGTYRIPAMFSHTEDYDLAYITLDGVSLGQYRIVIPKNDMIAAEYAQYIYDYIAEMSGFGLDIVYDTEAACDHEIIVGATSRKANPITAVEEYSVYEENGKIYVFYGDEQSAEMACLDLCEKILGVGSEGYDGYGSVTVKPGASYSGKWSVLSRFGVMSDSHVGARYNWANYNWLHNAFTTFETVHANDPLDFIVSLGDNIDDGYESTYAADYNVYLEEIKELDICDPVNPIDGRADGMIPHYEICGNHDPIGGQLDANGNLKIRFLKNKLWYTENENGEKVAHIAYFTDYGGYPLYEYSYSDSYESYFSYGKVNDQMVKFVEDSIIAANAEGAKHIILYNHYGMSQQVGSPMLPETGLGKIASVCEKYGIKLYFNGHEHNVPYTLRRYNDIYDYDVSMTAQKHAIVEITTLRAKVTIYNSADNSLYREDIVPLSGRGEAKQTFAE